MHWMVSSGILCHGISSWFGEYAQRPFPDPKPIIDAIQVSVCCTFHLGFQ